MKKIVAILLAALLVLSLTACDGGGGKKPAPPTSEKIYTLEKDGITYSLKVGNINELRVSKVVTDELTGIGDYNATKVYTATLSNVSDTGATIDALSVKGMEYDKDWSHPIPSDQGEPIKNNLKSELTANPFKGPIAVTFSGDKLSVADDKVADLDPTASYWASVDKIDPTFELRDYSTAVVPDLFTAVDGSKITTSAEWEANRQALIKLFEEEVFGPIPTDGFDVSFAKVSEEDYANGKGVKRAIKVTITTGKGSKDANMTLYLPKNAGKAVPVVVGISGDNFAETAVNAGYALCSINSSDYSPDSNDNWKNGIISIFDEPQFRTLSAWAFGISRAVDYFETIPTEIDNDKIIARGMSRTGKAAMWATVNDLRIDGMISSQSGTGGDQIVKNTSGETVVNIVGGPGNGGMPYWVCDNFKKYADNEAALPIDFHQLVALVAPRPYYQITAYLDNTSGDPFGQYNTFMIANAVWELYGYDIPEYNEQPPAWYVQHKGDMTCFHTKYAKHSETVPDFEMYLKFFKEDLGW